MICSVGGLAFEYRDSSERYTIQRVVVENCYRLPPSMAGQNVIDVGGHIGSFAVKAAAAGARVISVEPEASNATLLRINAAGNEYKGRPLDLAVICAAVGDHGLRRLYLDEENTGCHSFQPNLEGRRRRHFQDVLTIELEALMDHYFPEVGLSSFRVDLLKLDCEGSEMEILQSLLDSSRLAAVGAVLVEFHDRSGRSAGAITDALAREGFNASRLSASEVHFHR